MAIKVDLVIIDPQNDFMDSPGATLPVSGANEDMKRLSVLVKRLSRKWNDIHVTMDSHHLIDVGHPGMWQNQDGIMPSPYTMISSDDIENGIWMPRNPVFHQRMLNYAKSLERQGKYRLMVWPEHCIIGTYGHNIQGDLMKALLNWERTEFANVDFVTKGTNVFTEHYGALMAEVPDLSDPSTCLNSKFLTILDETDMVAIAGEALSHCVKATVDQIADNIGEEQLKKFYILTDCSSPVPKVGDGPDFPAIAQAWLKEMEVRGMNLTTSEKFLA